MYRGKYKSPDEVERGRDELLEIVRPVEPGADRAALLRRGRPPANRRAALLSEGWPTNGVSSRRRDGSPSRPK